MENRDDLWNAQVTVRMGGENARRGVSGRRVGPLRPRLIFALAHPVHLAQATGAVDRLRLALAEEASSAPASGAPNIFAGAALETDPPQLAGTIEEAYALLSAEAPTIALIGLDAALPRDAFATRMALGQASRGKLLADMNASLGETLALIRWLRAPWPPAVASPYIVACMSGGGQVEEQICIQAVLAGADDVLNYYEPTLPHEVMLGWWARQLAQQTYRQPGQR